MLTLSKVLLLVISSLSIVNSQLMNNNAGAAAGAGVGAGAAGAGAGAATSATGACTKLIGSTQCSEFTEIHAKVSQMEFDKLVKDKVTALQAALKGTVGTTCATYDTAFSTNVKSLNSYACALVLSSQGCTGNSVLCPSLCTDLNTSLTNVGCINTAAQAKVVTACNGFSGTSELNCVGVPSGAKSNLAGTSNLGVTTAGQTMATTTLAKATKTKVKATAETKSDSKSSSKESEKKGGSFFTSTTFFIILGVLVLVIGVLAFFYYMGVKDEKEEMMRNMESGKGGDMNQNNNYGTQTVEVNKTQNIEVNNNDYTTRSPYDANDGKPLNASADPFADSNRVDPNNQYNSGYNGNNSNSNNDYGLSNDYNNFSDLQNSVSYQNPAMMAAPVAVENPFDNASIVQDNADTQYNKNMQELSKNFPADDMPVPSVVKMTSIETPQQGNTNNGDAAKNNENDDDILKPSMVRMTNIETPVPTNTIPSEKDINIGDDILKPSMVTLTQIQTPKEANLSSEADKEKEAEDDGPKKAVVNMIDLKTPASNEALTPSIMITDIEGQTQPVESTQAQSQTDEEYSEMPDPKPYRCIHAYEPQIDDELRLDVDNDIDVLYEYDDGWCWAINKSTGEQGACPLLCLISVKEEATGDREWEKEMDVMKVPGRRESMLSNSFDPSRLSLSKN